MLKREATAYFDKRVVAAFVSEFSCAASLDAVAYRFNSGLFILQHLPKNCKLHEGTTQYFPVEFLLARKLRLQIADVKERFDREFE
jgi:hypothetical protein